MNSFGNIDVKNIENKAYITIETDKANELIERLNKENLLFFARYDDKKAMLQFDRTEYDKVNSVTAKFNSTRYEVIEPTETVIENNLKSTEMSIEQNYNMIDGVINNLPEEVREIKAETPPEHARKESENEDIMPRIAETLDISVAQVMALPEELKEIAATIYIENADLPKSELKELLSDALELTPQASDITHHEDVSIETAEVKDVPERRRAETTDERHVPLFSRAVQQTFVETAGRENQKCDTDTHQKQQTEKEL